MLPYAVKAIGLALLQVLDLHENEDYEYKGHKNSELASAIELVIVSPTYCLIAYDSEVLKTPNSTVKKCDVNDWLKKGEPYADLRTFLPINAKRTQFYSELQEIIAENAALISGLDENTKEKAI